MRREQEGPQGQPSLRATEETSTEIEKEVEIVPGSLEDNGHKINPVYNPWAGMVSEIDPFLGQGFFKGWPTTAPHYWGRAQAHRRYCSSIASDMKGA